MSGLVPRLAENLTRAGRQPSGKVNNPKRGWKCLDKRWGTSRTDTQPELGKNQQLCSPAFEKNQQLQARWKMSG